MLVTSFTLLFFLVHASIFSVFAQVELPSNSSSVQASDIPVITLTANTILIVKVTAVFTETDVIIASPVTVVTFTRLSTSIDAGIASHIALVSSQSTGSLPSSIEPSAPADETGTSHITLITSDPAQTFSSSNDPSIISDTTHTIDTTSITSGDDQSYPSGSMVHLSTPVDSRESTLPNSSTSKPVQSSPSNPTSNILTPIDAAPTAHLSAISSGTVQSFSYSSSNPFIETTNVSHIFPVSASLTQNPTSNPSRSLSVPSKSTEMTQSTLISSHTVQSSSSQFSTDLARTTGITIETNSDSSFPTKSSPTSSSSYDLDSTTVKWITKSSSLSPSTTTTTITYPRNGFGFHPSELGENQNVNMAAHAIQSSTSSRSLQMSEMNIISTISEISRITVPATTVYVTTSSSQNTTSINDSKSLLNTAKVSSSSFSSESSLSVTAKIIPASTFANNSTALPSLTTSAEAVPSSSRLRTSITSTMTITSKLPYFNTTYLLTQAEQNFPTSSPIGSSNNSSILISRTSPISPHLETKTSTNQTDTTNTSNPGHTPNLTQTFNPSQASNSIQAINTTQTCYSSFNSSQTSHQSTQITSLILERLTSKLESTSSHWIYSMASYSNAIPSSPGTIATHSNSTSVQPTETTSKVERSSTLDSISRRVDHRPDDEGSPRIGARGEESSRAGRSAADTWTLILRIVPLGLLLFIWLL